MNPKDMAGHEFPNEKAAQTGKRGGLSANAHDTKSRHLLAALGGCLVAALVAGAWFAGRQSASIQAQRLNTELSLTIQQLAAQRLALDQTKTRLANVERELAATGKSSVVTGERKAQQQLLEAQAAANQYREIAERQQLSLSANSRLLSVLAMRGARLLAMKTEPPAAGVNAYILMVENAKLIFVAGNLPTPDTGKHFELWILRGQEPRTVSAGAFEPEPDKQAFLQYSNSSLISAISAIKVTEEPASGSSTPGGPTLLSVALAGQDLAAR